MFVQCVKRDSWHITQDKLCVIKYASNFACAQKSKASCQLIQNNTTNTSSIRTRTHTHGTYPKTENWNPPTLKVFLFASNTSSPIIIGYSDRMHSIPFGSIVVWHSSHMKRTYLHFMVIYSFEPYNTPQSHARISLHRKFSIHVCPQTIFPGCVLASCIVCVASVVCNAFCESPDLLWKHGKYVHYTS